MGSSNEYSSAAKCGRVFTSTTSMAFAMAERLQHESEHCHLSSDMSLLEDEAASHPAYAAFVAEMDGCAYGDGPLNQAWHFFKAGFSAIPREVATKALEEILKLDEPEIVPLLGRPALLEAITGIFGIASRALATIRGGAGAAEGTKGA